MYEISKPGGKRYPSGDIPRAFIGQNAFKVQLEQAKTERKELESLEGELEGRLENLERVTGFLSVEDETDIRYRLDVIGRLFKVRAAVKQCRDNIKTLKQNSTLIQKQVQLETLIKIRADLEIRSRKIIEEKPLGRIRGKGSRGRTGRSRSREI